MSEESKKNTSGKVAYIFPGQGSQSVGMGLDFFNNFDASREIYERANNILNKNISEICFKGPEEDLKQTINAQSAIVTTSIAALSAFQTKCDIKPVVTLGHSLGEYCAMYCAGVMDFNTTIKAIQKRSELMHEATKLSEGAMSAILGSNIETIEKCIKEASSLGLVQIANYNDPTQIVITGEKEAVMKAGELIKENGAKRVVPLAVSGGFHSDLMKSAKDGFKDFAKDIKLNDAKLPVITNVDAQPTIKKDEFRDKMPKQISSSVMWLQSIQKAIELGVNTFIEFGSGKILAGLNRKISSEITTYNVYDKQSLEDTLQKFQSELIEV